MGGAVATIGIGRDPVRTAAREADAAAHPIVGTWLTMNPGTPPSASPVSFTADGIMTVAYAPSYLTLS